MHEWQDAEDYAHMALQHAERGQWRHAITSIRAAIAINPDRPGWHVLLGRALEETGGYGEALSSYRTADQLSGGRDAQTVLLLAGVYCHLERWVDVIDACERAQALDASMEACYCPRVAAYAALDEHDKAEEMFYLARLCTDECPRCLEHLGDSLAQRGESAKAMSAWRRALELPDARHQVHYKLADELARIGQTEQARSRYLAAMRQGGRAERAEALLRLAGLLLDMGRVQDAQERLVQLSAGQRDSARWYFLAARAAWLQQKVEPAPPEVAAGAAIEIFQQMSAEQLARRVLELDPTFPRVHLLLAEAAVNAGKLAVARRHLRRELMLHPDDPLLLRDLLDRMLELRLYRGAVKCARRLVRLDPQSPKAWQDLAVACFQQRKFEEGVAASLESLSREPGNVAVMHNMAFAMERSGRLDEAMRWVRLALDVDPVHPELRRLWLRVRVMTMIAGRPRLYRMVRKAAIWARRAVRQIRTSGFKST